MTEVRIINGRQVPYTIQRLAPDDVHLDVKNPRISYIIGRTPTGMSEDQIEELIWADNEVKQLANAIEQDGGVSESIIVEKRDGRFVVKEGNCRTVAVRRKRRLDPNNPAFAFLPAEVYEDLSEEETAVLLAETHVAGKIRWKAYEQAKVVHDLYYKYGKTYEWLADHMRLSKSKITQDLRAYTATKEYLETHPDPSNLEKFAFFQELMRKRDLAERFQNEPEFKKKFYSWLDRKRLSASAQVRHLDRYLSHPEAAKALDATGANAAEAVLIRDDPALESDVFEAVKRATEKVRGMPASEVQELGANPRKIIMLRELVRAVQDITTLANVSL